MLFAISNIRSLTIIIIGIIFLLISSIFLDIYDNSNILERNPIYRALGFGFATTGGAVIFNIISNLLIPSDLKEDLFSHRK